MFPVKAVDCAEFFLLDSLVDTVRHFATLRKLFGWTGAVKAILKVMSGRSGRIFYFVQDRGEVLHTGWRRRLGASTTLLSVVMWLSVPFGPLRLLVGVVWGPLVLKWP